MDRKEMDALWQYEVKQHTLQGHHVTEHSFDDSRSMTCEECNSLLIQSLNDGTGFEITHPNPVTTTPS